MSIAANVDEGGIAATGGYDAGSGGGGTTGGTSSGTTGGTSAPAVRSAGGGGVSTGQYIARTVAGAGGVIIPQPGPAIRVPRGAVVEVYPIGDNTDVVYTALSPHGSQGGPRAYHPAGAPVVTYSVTNMAEIWVNSKVLGEGVLLRIQTRG